MTTGFGTIGLPIWAAVSRPRPGAPLGAQPPERECIPRLEPEREPAVDFCPRYAIQQWRDGCWVALAEEIGPGGIAIGRLGRRGEDQPTVDRLAKFIPSGGDLRVSDLGGGVFRRIREPTLIPDGGRVRIGRHTLVLHLATRSRTNRSGGRPPCLELFSPEGRPGPRFPLIAPVTTIGRKSAQADIALVDDRLVSARHLVLRIDGQRVLATDLRTRNGSYVQIPDGDTIHPGEDVLVGHYRLRVTITNA
jgi:hypothetical protein